MAGFGDLPVGDNTSFAPVQATPMQAAPQAPAGNGGVFGFLYNNLIKPTANAVGGAVSDIPKIGSSLAYLGKVTAGEATGNQKAVQNATARQNQLLSTTNFNKNYEDPNLEKAVGKSAGQVTNLLAPVVGGEELAGKVGLKAIGSAAKVGGEIGAVGGAANAAAQGGSGEQVFQGAGEGGVTGLLTGAAGGVAGNVLRRTLNAVPGIASKGALTDAETAKGNFFDKAATNVAQNKYANAVQDEFGNGGKTMANNGMTINTVLSDMQKHGIPPTVENMAAYGKAGYAYNDVLNQLVSNGKPVRLDIGSIINNAVKSQPGLGSAIVKGSAANHITSGLRTLLTDSLTGGEGNISGFYHPGDILQASKDLLGASPSNGAEAAVFKNARTALINSVNNDGNLSKIIADHKLPNVEDVISGKDTTPEARDTQYILESAGNNPTLAQDVIDNINKANKIQDLQKAELPHIAADELAKSHASAIGQTLPEPTTPDKGFIGSPSGAYYATREAMGAVHNPLLAAPLIASRANGVINKVASHLGTPDMAQVGPRVSPDTTGTADISGTPQTPIQTGTPSSLIPQATGATVGAVTNAQVQPQGNQAPYTLDASGISQGVNQLADQANNPQPTLDASSIPGGTLQDLESEVSADPKNASIYQNIYDEAQKQVAASAPPKLNATEAKNLTNIQNATDKLSQYVDALNSLGSGSRGYGKGALASLLGGTGLLGGDAQKANAIQSQEEELAIQVAQALNNGTKPSQTQVNEIKKSIPSINDPKGTADQKIQYLAGSLADYLNTAVSASVTNRTTGTASGLLSQLGRQ